ncbi:hypothetical protein BS47DRAFT_1347982 [Hydnum rufescens UP504]|uniref:Uncharacterized protein n=1 Tax=Hydnum rufescens UP504 TaxID=1448309 RepID=A0A9P6DUB7_9AGAM|nr:hypothetical protein BS47DRAFT_1347982 [Hydnum rufescens UP504]
MPPHLHNFSLVFFPLYCSLIPVARLLTRPNGYFSILLDKVYGPRDAGTIVKLVALGAFHTFLTTAAGSAWAQSFHPADTKTNPRLAKNDLRGFPHRVTAAHQSLIEVFPGTTLQSASDFGPDPNPLLHSVRGHRRGDSRYPRHHHNRGPSTLIDGLILHFILKNVVFYISYLANDDFNRSASHVFAISTLMSVLFELSGAVRIS